MVNCFLGLSYWPPSLRLTSVFLRASVVVDDSPALREVPENQRKYTANVPARSLQVPFPQDQRGVFPQHSDFQARKVEFAHALPVRIALSVPFKNAVVAPNRAARS